MAPVSKSEGGRRLEEIFEVTYPLKDVAEFVKTAKEAGLDSLDDFVRTVAKLAIADYVESWARARAAELESRSRERGQAANVTPVDVEIAKMLSEMPEDKRAEVLRTLYAIQGVKSGDPIAATLALSTIVDKVARSPEERDELRKEIRRAIRRIARAVERAASKQQGGGDNNLLATVLTKMFDTLKESFDKQVEVLRSELQQLRSAVASGNKGGAESLREVAELLKALREVGVNAGLIPSKEYLDYQLELRKLETLERLKDRELETQKYIAELERAQRLKEMDAFSTAIDQITKAAVKAIAEVTEEESEEEGAQPCVRMVSCPRCGSTIAVAPGTRFARCLNCGHTFELQEHQGQGG